MSDYKITEQDIEGMLKYLSVFHPENANRDFAVEMLEYLKASYHRLAVTNPEALDELYAAFQSSISGTKAEILTESTNAMPSEDENIEHEKQQVSQISGTDISRVVYNQIGWTSRVYVVDDGRFIVKFPRKESVKKEYAQEIKIYRLLEQTTSSVQVPKLRWVGEDFNYIGYEGIIGSELDSVIADVAAETMRSIGSELGSFLKQLHDLHLDDPHTMTVDDEIKQFQDKYEQCIELIGHHFDSNQQSQLHDFIYTDMPDEMRRLGTKPVLCHGDLGYWNLIIKEDGHVGVIDFGDVGYYDQSKDFAGMTNKDMLDAALAQYGDSENLRSKISIRQKSIPFLDLNYYREVEDETKIQETVTYIKIQLEILGT